MRTINPKPENNREKPNVWKRLARCLLLCLLAVSLLYYRESLLKIFEGVKRVEKRWLGICLLLSGLGYLLEGMTISCMMGTVIPERRAKDGIFIALVCEFYRLTTLGNGSGFAQIHYLHEKGIETGTATVLAMIQYVMKRIAIMLFGVLGFVFLFHEPGTQKVFGEYTIFVGVGCFITATVILLFLCLSLSGKMAQAALWLLDLLRQRIPSMDGKILLWKEQIMLLHQSGRTVLCHKKKMIFVVLLQLGKLLLFYAIPACVLWKSPQLGAGGCILAMAVSFLLAGVIPAPSGAGSLEFTFLLFFIPFFGLESAAPAILVFRFVTWVCPALAGGGALLFKKLAAR